MPSSLLLFALPSARRRRASSGMSVRTTSRPSCSKAALDRVPGLDPATVDDVVIGCAMPEAEQGMNVARIASLRAGVPHSASAVTVNRFCASGLEAIACAVDRVRGGSADVVLAGGTESMSLVPMGGHKISPNPGLVGVVSGRLPDDRPGCRESRPRARHLARGAGRLRLREPSSRHRGAGRGPIRRRDRAGAHDAAVGVGRHGARHRAGHDLDRRGAEARHVARGAGQAAAGIPRERHGHCRQRVADERRRGSRRGDERGPGARARRDAAGQARGLRDGRRGTGALRHRTGAGGPQGAGASGPHAWPTST